ncbi:MAG: tetratricopeptide repeat-containing sensor histidine kinase [Cyclobacteriaceae bacterium]|nr:tetratricopeptide repeat-containing sensor histidine kinase [Cyclobacteriaceae bacterium]
MTLLVSFAQVAPSIGQDMNVAWYESFFQEKNKNTVQDALDKGMASFDDAVSVGDKAAEAKALNELGLIYLIRAHDFEAAIGYFISALGLEDTLDLKEGQIFTYLAMAHMSAVAGEYDKCGELLQTAWDINTKLNNTDVRVLILNEMGKINAAKGRADEAFENYGEVLAYKDEINNPKVEALALFNMAHLYTVQGKYEEALTHHKHALSIRRSIKDRKEEAVSLNDIGELYRLMKNDEKSFANHKVALEIRQALKDKRGEAESYNNIGALYYKQKKIERAANNLQLGLQAGLESNDQKEIRKSYEYLGACYEAAGDYKKALEYKNHFFDINDMMQRELNAQQLLDKQSSYVISKSAIKIQKLEEARREREAELINQKRFRNFLFVLMALGLVIVGLIFYLYILQQRSNKVLKAAHEKVNQQNLELQELNATKDKFFSIISHDLKGPLNSLSSFSNLLINHTESLSMEEIQMLARDFDKSLKNLFALLENLLEWSRSQTGNIEFSPEPFDLGAVLEENKSLLKAQAENKRINIVNENAEELVVQAHKNSVSTVVRNLISNAIKFTPEDGMITLNLRRNGADALFSVTDTGVGMSEDVLNKLFRIDAKLSTKGTANEKGTGLGLILCKEFIEKNGGRIWVKSKEGEGSVFYFLLPLTAPV